MKDTKSIFYLLFKLWFYEIDRKMAEDSETK